MLKREHVGVAGSGTTTAMSLLVQTWHEARSLDSVCPWHIFHSGERVHAFCGITQGQGSTMLPCQDTARPLGLPIEEPVRHGVIEHRGTEKIRLLLVSRDPQEYAPIFRSS